MFRSPTGMKFEPLPEDDPSQASENQRQVNILSTASPSAFIDVQAMDLPMTRETRNRRFVLNHTN